MAVIEFIDQIEKEGGGWKKKKKKKEKCVHTGHAAT